MARFTILKQKHAISALLLVALAANGMRRQPPPPLKIEAIMMAFQSLVDSKALECKAESTIVWVFDGTPSGSFPSQTRVLCGSTQCLKKAGPCTTRLLVQDLARETHVEQWVREHVLAKIRSAHYYELQLQVVMQLAALYRYGGALGDSSVSHKDEWIVGANCQPTLTETGLVGASLKKETISELLLKFVAEYSSSVDWPVAMDWQKVFSILDCSLFVANKPAPTRLPNLEPRGLRYGTLSYDTRRQYLLAHENNGMDLGDEMQGLAGIQFLPYLDALVERDSINLVYGTQNLKAPIKEKTLVFANAWYGSSTKQWPPPDYIDPVLVAIHMETDKQTQDTFDRGMKWLQQRWPVGVRDIATRDYFSKNNVSSFVSNCMTLTIVPLCRSRRSNNKILAVDIGQDMNWTALGVPSDIPVNMKTHKSVDPVVCGSSISRYTSAYEILRKYACEAQVVVTKRLHSALPTAASGTPAMWVDGNTQLLPGGA